ncbi:hypothetical protein M3204_03700 [Mesobacillus subterraneus]|nr:hypothetical protein [Mesobacillus subterraneus]
MKSFFDFIGRTEATRGARRWSWTFLEVKFYAFLYLQKNSLPISGASFIF